MSEKPCSPQGGDFEDCRNDTRRREDAAIRMEQKFVDFMEIYKEDKRTTLVAYNKDKEDTEIWRTQFDKRIKPLEVAFFEARWPRRIALVIISSMFGAFGLWIFGKIIDHIK